MEKFQYLIIVILFSYGCKSEYPYTIPQIEPKYFESDEKCNHSTFNLNDTLPAVILKSKLFGDAIATIRSYEKEHSISHQDKIIIHIGYSPHYSLYGYTLYHLGKNEFSIVEKISPMSTWESEEVRVIENIPSLGLSDTILNNLDLLDSIFIYKNCFLEPEKKHIVILYTNNSIRFGYYLIGEDHIFLDSKISSSVEKFMKDFYKIRNEKDTFK